MKDYETSLTVERVKEVLNYNQETGVFTWRVQKSARGNIRSVAGTSGRMGYWSIQIDNKIYKAHRLAWFVTYGRWPKDQIDHINGIRGDNRITNLREATPLQNARNTGAHRLNTSGFKGVVWHKYRKKWRSTICINRKKKHLGTFSSAEEAGEAYQKAALEHYGEFARR